MSKEFGQRVSAYIEREELSQRALAKIIHIRRSTISRVLNGGTDLSPKDAARFERGLRIPVGEKIEFNFSSQGVPNSRIEELQGKPLRDLESIRQDKMKVIVRGKTVIRYR